MVSRTRNLPSELIDIILSRLPSKSLLRFRCVCKSWGDYISSPEFIKLHRDNKLHGHLLIQHDSLYSLHRVLPHEIMVSQTKFCLPYQDVATHGYSNGLVCISTTDTSFDRLNLHLWNPSIRKFKTLPEPLLTMNGGSVLAFCYVPRINDYRLLRMPDNELHDRQSEIYSFHTNSWKLIENKPFYFLIDSNYFSDGNGVVYFQAVQINSGYNVEETIISFDMADEVFTTIKIRGVVTDYVVSRDAVNPIFFGASLFLMHIQEGQGQGIDVDKVDVWERKVRDGGTESWTKIHTIDGTIRPVGFLKNGEMVCLHGPGDTWITSYDPRISGKFKGLPFGRMSRNLNLATYFVESLMLLDE